MNKKKNKKSPCEGCEHIDKSPEWCNEHCENEEQNEKVNAMSRVFRRWSLEEAFEKKTGIKLIDCFEEKKGDL